jgi:hypothetical protein
VEREAKYESEKLKRTSFHVFGYVPNLTIYIINMGIYNFFRNMDIEKSQKEHAFSIFHFEYFIFLAINCQQKKGY